MHVVVSTREYVNVWKRERENEREARIKQVVVHL